MNMCPGEFLALDRSWVPGVNRLHNWDLPASSHLVDKRDLIPLEALNHGLSTGVALTLDNGTTVGYDPQDRGACECLDLTLALCLPSSFLSGMEMTSSGASFLVASHKTQWSGMPVHLSFHLTCPLNTGPAFFMQ